MQKMTAFILVILMVIAPYTPLFAEDQSTNYETRLTALEDEIRSTNGKIEQLDYSIHRLEQTVQHLQTDLEARVSKLETTGTAVPPPVTIQSPVPIQTSSAAVPPPSTVPPSEPINGTLGSLKMQGGVVTGGVINPVAPPLPSTPPDYGLTPQEQYDRAFGLLRQADYDNAEKAFKLFIDKNPKDKLLDNAKYWYGETLYVRGRFNESTVAFAEAFQQNPQGSKAPDSLLKLAMSLENIEKISDACTTLIELKNKYPNASVSIKNRADEERSKMRCGH